MHSISINTSQNVNLEFPVASVGVRMVAFVVDMMIKVAYMVVLGLILFELLNFEAVISAWDNWSVMAFFSVVALPITFYTVLFESMMEGQTPGKRMMKCKVIKIDGYQAEFMDYLTRWVFRIIDIYISSAVVGLLSILTSKNAQRLGGMASGTAVISLKQDTFLSETLTTDLENEYQPLFPQVLSITDKDMRIVVKNYQQAQATKRYAIIQKLAAKIREITQITDQKELSDNAFIQQIIKDFNHYTGKEK